MIGLSLLTVRLWPVKIVILLCAAILLTACAGGSRKSDDGSNQAAKPELKATLSYVPKQQRDKETGKMLFYKAKPNPYLLLKGRIDKPSVNHFIRAKRALKANNLDQADSILRELIAGDAKLSGPWVLRGDIALEKDDAESAVSYYRKAISANRKNVNAYLRLAQQQRILGKFIEAQNTYAKALSVWSDFPEAHLNLGVLYDVYLNLPLRAQRHIEAYLFLTDFENKQAKEWLKEIQSRTGKKTELTKNVKPEPNMQ